MIRRSESKVDSFKDIFYKLTYRQKYEQVSSKNVQLYGQLNESEIQYRSIFEKARDGIIIFCKDQKLLAANKCLIHLSGYSKDEFLSLKLSDIFKEASLRESKERIRKLLNEEQTPLFEAHLITKMGALIPVEISVTYLKNLYGQKIVFQGIVRDITERKKAQATIERNELVLKLFVENAPASIAMIDQEMKYIAVSRRFLMDYNLGEKNVIGRSHYELFPEITERWKEIHQRCLAGAVEKAEEDAFHRADGKVDWVRWEIHPWYEQKDKVGGIILFSEIITERKQAKEILSLSEEKYRFMFENNPAPMWIYDLETLAFLEINNAAEQHYGYSREEFLSMTLIDIRPKEDLDAFFENLDQKGPVLNFSGEWRHKKKNGEIITVEINSHFLVLNNRNARHVIVSDITKRKQAEEKLKEYYALMHIAGETAKLGGWYVNLEENRSYWSDQVAAIHEMPVGYVPPVEKGILFYAPEWRDKITQVFTNCAQNGIRYDEEMEIITSKGNRVWVRTIGEAVKNDKGKIVKVQGAFQDITVRKKAESELKESENRYRRLFESAKGILILDAESGMIVDVNPFLIELLGYSHEVFLQKKIWEIGLFKNIIANKDNFLELQQNEYIRYEDLPLETFEGKVIYVEFISNVYLVNSAKVIQCNIRDISEKKIADESLRLSNQTIRNIVDFSPALIYIFNLKGEFLLANKNFEKLLGIAQEELLGQTREKIFSKKVAEQHRNNDLKVIKLKQSIFFEEENMEANGKHFYLTSKFPLYDAEGNIYAVGGISTDITERKEAEKEIYDANSELQMLNNTILTLIGSSDLNKTLNKVLETALEVVGLEGGTICLINPDNTFNLVAERAASKETIEDFTNNKVKIGDCLCGNCALDCKPLILQTKEEVLKYATREVLRGEDIRFHASFPFVVGGKSLGILCVFTRTDAKPSKRKLKLLETIVLQTSIIIENIRLYEEINENNTNLENIVSTRTKQLDAANKELQTFTYSVSHDLKAPLRGIDGYSNLLQELYSANLNEEAQNFIRSIRNGTKQMNSLINDLLDYSRLERATLRNEPIKINELLKLLKSQFETEISNTKCAFSIKVPDIEIVADMQGLTIALRNLIENAIKFSAVQKKPTVEISLKNKPTSWLLAIKDNGIGFDMKYKDRIFEIFQQLNLPEEFPGTGIGLAMVHKSMEKMGGKVWAESKLEEGAVFYLEIPKQLK
ncbi:MAG: PAS domain S-box protein [Lutibacter sp.]|nr:PAS domain S-box protein [Lutibacter sp.]